MQHEMQGNTIIITGAQAANTSVGKLTPDMQGPRSGGAGAGAAAQPASAAPKAVEDDDDGPPPTSFEAVAEDQD